MAREKPAFHDCGMKRWAVVHPLLCCALGAVAWYALLFATGSPLVAAVAPVVLTGLLGWWREDGLRWQRPLPRWWLVTPPLVVGIVAHHSLALAVMATAVGVEIARGYGQYAVRRFGPWLVSVAFAPLFAVADLLVLPPGWASVALALAVSFCLTALRWRINTIWPLVVVHAVLIPVTAPVWWLLVLAAALTGYGLWLLRGHPVVHMRERRTVRVLCLDDRDRVLLVGWHDPSDGSCAWDMPGGGVEPGESPLEAARRELHEETGLPPECVQDKTIWVMRNTYWNNKRVLGPEQYFLARVDQPGELDRSGLEPHEITMIREFRWVDLDKATSIEGRIQLYTIHEVAAQLTG